MYKIFQMTLICEFNTFLIMILVQFTEPVKNFFSDVWTCHKKNLSVIVEFCDFSPLFCEDNNFK